jgi:hypothetical protein
VLLQVAHYLILTHLQESGITPEMINLPPAQQQGRSPHVPQPAAAAADLALAGLAGLGPSPPMQATGAAAARVEQARLASKRENKVVKQLQAIQQVTLWA